jgi:hypothetical protein
MFYPKHSLNVADLVTNGEKALAKEPTSDNELAEPKPIHPCRKKRKLSKTKLSLLRIPARRP